MSSTNQYRQFKKPGASWRGKPFWSWNGMLAEKELLRQAAAFKEMGFGGYFMHSRCGLQTEYLGEDWFRLTNAVADAGEKAGMESWLYDEDRWPSGSAGGKVTEDETLRAKSLVLFEADTERFEWSPDILCAFSATIAPDGISMRDCRMLAIGERPQPCAAAPDGWKQKAIWFRVISDKPNSNFNGNTYIDTMNPKAVQRFIDLTHEQYASRCGNRLGSSIPGIFTDEPHRGAYMGQLEENDGVRSDRVFYTDDLFPEFLARYGYDLLPRLPEIFYRLNGEIMSKVRIDFVDIGCNLFTERFGKAIYDWCNAHGLDFTGHVLHEDSLVNQTVPNGSLMRFYEYESVPGIDILGSKNHCWWAAKQCSSICRQLGKQRMLSELYGCSGWEFTFRSHKTIGDWQALLGVNLRCPHLSWYTMEGECKRDYPASISVQSAWWRDYDYVETYFARLGFLLAQGTPVCNLLVLEPIESVWGISHIGWASWIFNRPGDKVLEGIEAAYEETFRLLAGARIDFDYGEEQLMARHGSVSKDEQGALLRIGKAKYRTVLITGALTVRSSTLAMLRRFLRAGGRVVLAGDPPEYVDGVRSNACAELKSLGAVVCKSGKMLDALKPSCAAPITADAGNKVFAQVRRDGDRYISVWLNTDDKNASGNFTVRAALPKGYRAEYWRLETGEKFTMPFSRDGKAMLVPCALDAAGSMAIVFTKDTDKLPVYGAALPKECGSITKDEFAYELNEPNVCVLDYARCRFGDDADFGPLKEVLKLDASIRDRLGLEHRGGEMLQPWFAATQPQPSYGSLTLEYPFRVDEIPEGDVFVATEHPELFHVSVNGVPLSAGDPDDFWVDASFIKLPIPSGTLKAGENRVTLTGDFRRSSNIEAVYLLGAFGVRAKAGASALIKPPATLGLDDCAERGLPFYGGEITLVIPPEKYLKQIRSDADRVTVRVPDFSGALVRVGDGSSAAIIAWEPYTADITKLVRAKKPLHVTLVNTRRNTFGPLHIYPTRRDAYGPGEFMTEGDGWTDDYARIPASTGAVRFLCD